MAKKAPQQPYSKRDVAKALLDDLCKTGLKVSAERIWHACDLIENLGEGATKITVSAVARICVDEFGGPKAQSIRNQATTLKKLISLRADALSISTSGTKYEQDDFETGDPNTMAYLRVLRERIRQTERSNSRLRAVLKNLDPRTFEFVISESQEIELANSGSSNEPSSIHRISYAEGESLRSFLKTSNLERFGLRFDNRDRIVEGSSVLMESPAVSAIRRLAKQ